MGGETGEGNTGKTPHRSGLGTRSRGLPTRSQGGIAGRMSVEVVRWVARVRCGGSPLKGIPVRGGKIFGN
jgi:hypothetical protein